MIFFVSDGIFPLEGMRAWRYFWRDGMFFDETIFQWLKNAVIFSTVKKKYCHADGIFKKLIVRDICDGIFSCVTVFLIPRLYACVTVFLKNTVTVFLWRYLFLLWRYFLLNWWRYCFPLEGRRRWRYFCVTVFFTKCVTVFCMLVTVFSVELITRNHNFSKSLQAVF